MERPQNGLNGNIPQHNYGYVTSSFPIGAQMPRGNAQAMYGFESMPQVMSNAFMNPGFNPNMQHNVANAMRSMSPSVTQSPIFLQSYVPQNYVQPMHTYQTYPTSYSHQFNYQQEIQPSPVKPAVNTQPTRKLNPLIVIDPKSNTDVDLSRFSVDRTLTVSEPLVTKHKTSKSDSIEQKDIKQVDTLLKQENITESCIIPTDTDKECNYEKEHFENTVIQCNIICDEKPSELSIKEDDVLIELEAPSSLKSLEKIEFEEFDLQNKVPESSIKLENEEEAVTCSSEDEIHILDSKLSSSSYHLPVNKKESDETTLKRKLIYDRHYLIKMKDNQKSRQKPLNMPATTEFSEDIISNQPRIISCQLPESSTSQINNEKANKKQLPNRQYGSYKKYNHRQPERKQINLEISDNQVFIRSKSGYLPPQLRDKQKTVDSLEELKRNIKSNLNKITPQNFPECVKEIEKLNIENKEEVSCLINEIFIKAVKEEAYSVTYAQFCYKLAITYVDNPAFKGQLLKKCQDMFETPLQDQLENVRNEWKEKVINETDSKMKALYESDLEEQVKKAKDKYFGNIRFIGELFLHNLLAGKVILNCILELLRDSYDSDAMLALCKLLETCGKQIDVKHKDSMNKYIFEINRLSQSSDLEKRIRFKLKDIIDMRDRNWALRHVQQEKQINPKTLEEQKAEQIAEANAAAIKFNLMTKKKNVTNPQNTNSRRNINKNVSIKNLSCNSHKVDEKTVLGPVLSNWVTGSGSKAKSHEAEGWTPVSQKPKSSAMRYTSNSRSREQSPQVIFANKYRNLESSAEASGADSRSSTPPLNRPITKAYRIIEAGVTDEDTAEIIFNDLLSTGNFDTKKWLKLHKVQPVIEKWIDDMLEKDVSCRRQIGDSFNRLLIDKIITIEQIIEGTQAFVSNIDDLICDIPKLWEFFAQFLERFIYDKNSNIAFFENIFKSILPNNDVALCLSTALHEASSRLGHKIVGQVFHKSLKWEKFVPNHRETFLKTNNLEFTVDLPGLSPYGGDPLNFIAEELDDMLANNLSNEKIFEFLESHVDKPTWKKSECTKTITSSILKALRKIPETLVPEYLKNKKEIIKRISNHKLENEIEILKSVLNIASELNKETLNRIYDLLITEKIVSQQALTIYCDNESLKSENNFKLTNSLLSNILFLNDKP